MKVLASPRILEFFNSCHAPDSGKFCQSNRTERYSRGVLGRGTESHGTRQVPCGKAAIESGMCAKHLAENKMMERVNAERRAAAVRPLNDNQLRTLRRIADPNQHSGATKADATRLLRDGLIERISGKGRGQGNTPQWQVTEKGRKLIKPDATPDKQATFPKIKIGGKEHKIVGETETHWHVESSREGGKPLPYRKTDVAHLIQK